MALVRHSRSVATALLLLAAFSPTLARAQAPPATPAPGPPAAATAPTTPVTSIRNKISAGDLLSAESIDEVWRTQHGTDSAWLSGHAWLARGAFQFGEFAKARAYADTVHRICRERIATGADLDQDGALETALGAAIEVRAQSIAGTQGAAAAARDLRHEIASQRGPVSLQSRLYKRLNLLTLAGQPAPEFEADSGATLTTTMSALRGSPVLVFVFNPSCGDCRAQEPTLEALRNRHAKDGLKVVALTRWYEGAADRAHERAALDSVWASTYKGMQEAPVVVSTASMVRYGGSSTPTFVFVDRKGIVRDYLPVRLTESEFERRLARILAK